MTAPYEFAYRIRDLEEALKNCKTSLPLSDTAITARILEINQIIDNSLKTPELSECISEMPLR